MIDFYYWPTPNGWKIAIALEEMNLPYTTQLVNIGKGEQFNPNFLKISPNNRMPAIVDRDILWHNLSRPAGRRSMADVANGWAWPHGRAKSPLQQIRPAYG